MKIKTFSAILLFAVSAFPACAQTTLPDAGNVESVLQRLANSAIEQQAKKTLAQAEAISALLAAHRALHAAEAPGWPCRDRKERVALALRSAAEEWAMPQSRNREHLLSRAAGCSDCNDCPECMDIAQPSLARAVDCIDCADFDTPV